MVIPVYNQVDLLDRCLLSLEGQQGFASGELEMLTVDDQSPQNPAPVVARHPTVIGLRMDRNGGYAAANNLGLAAARGAKLLFLNSDTEVPPEGLARLEAELDARPKFGGISPLHRETSGAVQRTCFAFPTLRTGWLWDSFVHRRRPDHPILKAFEMADWDHASSRPVDHAQTSCLLIRREVYDQIGGMDPRLFLFYNDTDFCYRMKQAGFPIWFTAETEILHHGGASVGTFDRAEAQVYGDRYRYFRKWFGWRGAMAVPGALWSRIVYESLVELAHGDIRFALKKIKRGLRLNRAFVAS